MIVQYYTRSELESAKKVSDNELNDLLQEVRSIDDRHYLFERKYTIKKGWFKKPIEVIGYSLMVNINGNECQLINFCQDHGWSINGVVGKSYIYTYFMAYLNCFDFTSVKKNKKWMKQ